jgi:hypothetical protein
MRFLVRVLFIYFVALYVHVPDVKGASVPSVTISWDAVTQDTSGNTETEPIWYWVFGATWPDFLPGSANFIASTLANSYQYFDSRLSDSSVQFYYVVYAVDLWGNRSRVSARVGTSSYVVANIQVFLEGCFHRATRNMTASLSAKKVLPLSSPYSALAPRTVTSIPNDIIDWVLVELRQNPAGPAIARRSFFLRMDGFITEPDGITTQIGIPHADSGRYYLVIRHRNHITVMSRDTVSLDTSRTVLYDFGTDTTRYYGSHACVNIQGSGIWGLWAGDVNGSGIIDQTDDVSVWNDRNKSGYRNTDCDLDAIVNARDRSVVYNNRNKRSAVP